MSQFGPLTIGDDFDHDDEVLVGDAEGDHVLGYATRANIEALHGHLTTLLGYDAADGTEPELGEEEVDVSAPALDPGRVQAFGIAAGLLGQIVPRADAVDDILHAASWLLDEDAWDYEVTPTHDDTDDPNPDGTVIPFPVLPPFRPHEA